MATVILSHPVPSLSVSGAKHASHSCVCVCVSEQNVVNNIQWNRSLSLYEDTPELRTPL